LSVFVCRDSKKVIQEKIVIAEKKLALCEDNSLMKVFWENQIIDLKKQLKDEKIINKSFKQVVEWKTKGKF
jgi:hypothetical protein